MTARRRPTRPHDRILLTATRLFREHGIRAVSVRRIVAEAGVAQMTPYRRIGGKGQVVAATLERSSAGRLRALSDHMEQGGDDLNARFAGLWAAVEEWQAADGRLGSLILNAAVEFRGERAHPADAVIQAHQRAIREVLEDLAKRSGADDPIELAAQLHLVLDGALTAAVVEPGLLPAMRTRAVAEAVLEAHLAGTARR